MDYKIFLLVLGFIGILLVHRTQAKGFNIEPISAGWKDAVEFCASSDNMLVPGRRYRAKALMKALDEGQSVWLNGWRAATDSSPDADGKLATIKVDFSRSDKKPIRVVCQFEGVFYDSMRDAASIEDAQALCKKDGASLAKVERAEDLKILPGKIVEDTPYWVNSVLASDSVIKQCLVAKRVNDDVEYNYEECDRKLDFICIRDEDLIESFAPLISLKQAKYAEFQDTIEKHKSKMASSIVAVNEVTLKTIEPSSTVEPFSTVEPSFSMEKPLSTDTILLEESTSIEKIASTEISSASKLKVTGTAFSQETSMLMSSMTTRLTPSESVTFYDHQGSSESRRSSQSEPYFGSHSLSVGQSLSKHSVTFPEMFESPSETREIILETIWTSPRNDDMFTDMESQITKSESSVDKHIMSSLYISNVTEVLNSSEARQLATKYDVGSAGFVDTIVEELSSLPTVWTSATLHTFTTPIIAIDHFIKSYSETYSTPIHKDVTEKSDMYQNAELTSHSAVSSLTVQTRSETTKIVTAAPVMSSEISRSDISMSAVSYTTNVVPTGIDFYDSNLEHDTKTVELESKLIKTKLDVLSTRSKPAYTTDDDISGIAGDFATGYSAYAGIDSSFEISKSSIAATLYYKQLSSIQSTPRQNILDLSKIVELDTSTKFENYSITSTSQSELSSTTTGSTSCSVVGTVSHCPDTSRDPTFPKTCSDRYCPEVLPEQTNAFQITSDLLSLSTKASVMTSSHSSTYAPGLNEMTKAINPVKFTYSTQTLNDIKSDMGMDSSSSFETETTDIQPSLTFEIGKSIDFSNYVTARTSSKIVPDIVPKRYDSDETDDYDYDTSTSSSSVTPLYDGNFQGSRDKTDVQITGDFSDEEKDDNEIFGNESSEKAVGNAGQTDEEAEVGIWVAFGILIVLVLVAVIVAVYLWRRRQRQKSKDITTKNGAAPPPAGETVELRDSRSPSRENGVPRESSTFKDSAYDV